VSRWCDQFLRDLLSVWSGQLFGMQRRRVSCCRSGRLSTADVDMLSNRSRWSN